MRRIKKIVDGHEIDERRLKETTLYNLHRVLSIAFKQAVRNRLIEVNPLDFVTTPKQTKYNHTILTVEQSKQLLSAAEESSLYLPILFAGVMGLRRGEALGLRWSDVDFSSDTLKINKSRTYMNKQIIFAEAKTQKSQRTLYMPGFLSAILKFHKTKITFSKNNPDHFICINLLGDPLHPNYISKNFKKLSTSLGFPNMRFHDLRHTTAALMVAAGASPKEVSDFLGHTTISITMDLYADIFDTTKKQTAQKMDLLFTK